LGPIEHRFVLAEGFPAESRFLDGHFPGNPVVPGAVILGYLAQCLGTRGLGVAGVRRMKFRRVLRPGVPFEVAVIGRADGVSAEFSDAGGVFASASLRLRASDG